MADEQRGLKDRNLQHYYESMLTMFETPGWKYLTEDLTKIQGTANTLVGIASQSDLDKRLGQIDILNMIVAQPIVIRHAYDLLLEDDTA